LPIKPEIFYYIFESSFLTGFHSIFLGILFINLICGILLGKNMDEVGYGMLITNLNQVFPQDSKQAFPLKNK